MMVPHLPVASSTDATLMVGWPLPIWLLSLVLVAIAAFAAWIYWTEAGRLSRTMRVALAVIRFTLLALALWMLTGWSWQRARVERPELVIAVDVSESMLTPDGDSTANRSGNRGTTRLEVAQNLLTLGDRRWDRLRERYQLRAYAIAEDAAPVDLFSSAGKLVPIAENLPPGLLTTQSRLGDALGQVADRQAGRGTAAIVFLSDGVTTSGMDLSEAAERAKRQSVPIYAVALGRQFALPDLRVNHVLAESQVYLEDRVSIEAVVAGSDIQDVTAQVKLIDDTTKAVHDEQSVQLTQGENQKTVTLGFVPREAGEINLRVEIQKLRGEQNTTNNSASVKLNVQDRVIRVLMVFSQPSYEFRYLKHFLERSRQGESSQSAAFELTAVLQEGDQDYVAQDSTAERFIPSNPDRLSQYDVFLFGGSDPNLIPRNTQHAIVQAVTRDGAGCIFLVDGGNPIQRLTGFPLGLLLPIESASSIQRSEQGFLFTSTKLGQSSLPLQLDLNNSRDSISVVQHLPPLHSILRIDTIKPGAQVWADATAIDDGSTSPLMITQFAGAGRTGLLATDETYRWSSVHGSDQVHQRFWGQTLRWLCRGKLSGDSASELIAEPKQVRIGSPVRLQLQLPIGRELPQQAEVRVTGNDGLGRDVTLKRQPGVRATYQASVEQLAVGKYRAALVRPPQSAPPSTEFTVFAPPGELANLQADAQSMQRLAELSGGKFYQADNAEAWFESLPPGRPVRLGNLPPEPIWNQHWVALLFVGLITAEWLLRRYARLI